MPGEYSLWNAAALARVQSLERAELAMLARHGMADLEHARVLDVGCGYGLQLRRFVEYGASPANCTGIDLSPERIDRAAEMNPAIDWRVGSAERLPFAYGSFDVVCTYTLLSSILEYSTRVQIASEMWRVCRAGGLVLVYDFTMDNPHNGAVRGVSRREIRALFPGAYITMRRLTLAPPIARMVTRRSAALAHALEAIGLLNTHILAGITKRARLS